MGKIVQKSISYSGVSARNYVDIVDTLYAGESSLTIHSATIKSSSTISLFTDLYGWNPSSVSIGNSYITLTFPTKAENHRVKVRVWDEHTGGAIYEDGNDIYYPISDPSQENKLYKEADVSAIAYALGQTLKISEMAGAVQTVVERTEITQYSGARAMVVADVETPAVIVLQQISDSFTGDGSTKVFELTNHVEVMGFVKVDGNYVNEYTFNRAYNTITFDVAPASNVAIVVGYWVMP